ncbi:MAG TPA: hypothetical protein VKI17_11505, partial [Gemmataceae bacterium]|nr:hypothetical protein [Gemmataceae bacterium]
IMAAWGLRDQSPVLLPAYLQAVPVVGIGLALTGLILISRSEGTLTGRKLANWGLGVCALTALGYWAYYAALSFAVGDQAETFARNWFQKLMASGDDPVQLNSAFLDTQEPAQRQRINPSNTQEINLRFMMALPPAAGATQRGPLPAFREKDIVRVLRQGGPKSQVVSKGVKDWEYKSGGYRVELLFQVNTDDAVSELKVALHGVESRTHEFEGRAWYVLYGSTAVVRQAPTDLGQRVRALRKQSLQFIQNWGEKLGLGSLAMSYADTQDAGVRRRSQEQFIAQLTVYALSAIGKGYLHLLNLEALREWHRAEYADRYQKLGFPKKDRLGFDEEATRDAVLAGVRRLLGSSERGPLFFRLSPGDDSAVEPWRYDEKTQRLLLPHDCKLGFFTPDGAHRYEVDSIIMVQSDPGPIDPARRPDWRIAGLELIDARDLSLAGPGGPGMPNMPRGVKQGGPDPKFANPPPLGR